MQHIDLLRDWIQDPRHSKQIAGVGALVAVYSVYKLYSKYINSRKIFAAANAYDPSNVAVIITGAGSGIGYDAAMALNELGSQCQ